MSAVQERRYADRPVVRGGDRSGSTGVLRSLLLGVAVFAAAMLAGAVLAGATLAEPIGRPGAGPAPATEGAAGAEGAAGVARATRTGAGSAEVSDRHRDPRAGSPLADPGFAQSMVYSGGFGLVLSIFGTVMVGRRRRLW